jgi:outer membrane protein, heavy metal efflux system
MGSAGCAPVQHYQPAPLAPRPSAARLESQTLLDPELKQCLEQTDASLAVWPPRAWNPRLLTLAALCLSPALDVARAQAATAEAARITAGARPNPTISVAPGIPSPYLFGLNFTVPFESAGKRGLRMEEASDLSQSARLALGEAAWRVESGVRGALVNYFLAVRQLALLCREAQLRAEQAALLEERFRTGEIARPQWVASRVALESTRVSVRAAEGQTNEARAAVAAAVGVPAAALAQVQFSWPDFETLPGERKLSSEVVQREAVLNRLDVRRALAAYAAADVALRIEIARQHPNFNLGPGYQFEERNSYFTVGFSTTLPVFNRDQGPIAEAEARRKEAAAQFLSTQARVIAESEAALARYRSALGEFKEIQTSLIRLQDDREGMERQAVEAGESDQVQLNLVLIEKSAMAQAGLSALGRAQRALGALEDAVECPLEPDDLPALSAGSAILNSPSQEAKP